MKANVGTVDYQRAQILAGDHHIVLTRSLAVDQDVLPPGTVIADDGAGNRVAFDPLEDTPAHEPLDVLLEEVDTGTGGALTEAEGPVCVHGVVRRSKLVDNLGDPIADAVAVALEARGIFAE